MLVNLQNAWFDPAGNYRDPKDNPHDVPDSWKDLLPSTAEKLTPKEVKEVVAAEKEEATK